MSTKPCTVLDMTGTRSLDDFRASLETRAGRVRRAADKLDHEKAALRAVVLDALAAGLTEVETAEITGLSRMTVRAWAGK
jgi:hypothetical protein